MFASSEVKEFNLRLSSVLIFHSSPDESQLDVFWILNILLYSYDVSFKLICLGVVLAGERKHGLSL